MKNMKKRFLLMLAIMATAMVTYAQQVATLTHDKTITAYYGGSALTEALKVAVDGDVITLSDGVFNVDTINKAVSIIGAGMEYVNDKHPKRTTLKNSSGNCIYLAVDGKLTVSNIEFIQGLLRKKALNTASFVKCSFTGYVFMKNSSGGGDYNCKNVTFLQCRFNYIQHIDGDEAYYQNCCYVAGVYNATSFYISSKATVSFINCTINADFSYCYSGVFVNCVLCTNTNSGTPGFPSGSGYINTLTNCLGFNKSYSYSVFSNASNTNSLFYGNSWKFKANGLYELTDEAKAAVKGSDGTEVGMYGGAYPYDPIPEGPRITKFNVAKSSDTENKLNVEVEVTNGNTTSE